MNNKIILPFDVINKILIMRPSHPVSKLIKKEINKWTRKCYFYKHFFNTSDILNIKKKRDYNLDRRDFTLKMLLEGGKLSNHQAVNLIRESKLEKQRLRKKLEELNIKEYEISTSTFFPKKNKHGNFTTVKHKNKELIF